MVDPAEFVGALCETGVRFFSGVPDSVMKGLCDHLVAADGLEHVAAANEGTAVGLAVGHHIGAGAVPVVYMQNAGLGNAVNPLTSVAHPDVYGVPMVLIIGWRGEPGQSDEPQHIPQGRATLPMLEAMEIPCQVLSRTNPEALTQAAAAVEDAVARGAPVALVVRRGTFADAEGPRTSPQRSEREEVIRLAVELTEPNTILVATTGMAARELYEIRQSRGESGLDFLNVGGMGHTSQIALGIAMTRPERQVLCIDGDGSLLMHLGGLVVCGAARGTTNFKHLVINNGVHDSVGGQPTCGTELNMAALAGAAGYAHWNRVEVLEEVRAALTDLLGRPGPGMLEVVANPGHRGDLGRPSESPRVRLGSLMRSLSETR